MIYNMRYNDVIKKYSLRLIEVSRNGFVIRLAQITGSCRLDFAYVKNSTFAEAPVSPNRT